MKPSEAANTAVVSPIQISFGHSSRRASVRKLLHLITGASKNCGTIEIELWVGLTMQQNGLTVRSELESQSKFLDLAPTDTADEAGVYSDALFAAIGNPRVFNIALTGPYGSGKSSIIKSFLKKYRRTSLLISLAAFLPESGSKGVELEPDSVESTPTKAKATKQEIERSILQQMLYGADANKLPFSRFKRIQAPGRWSSRIISLYFALALFSCWHLLQKRDAIVKGDYFFPFAFSKWLNLTCFALGGTLLWLAVHRIYVASFGVSLKSLSLKDIEITPKAINQESILNRHLDEIIYFFQSTKYDLVIIEDLDRFNDPEIFVTLREINKIVNENSGVNWTCNGFVPVT